MIEIRVDADRLNATLEQWSAAMSDLSAPMAEAGLFMERETKLNFARQSDPDGAGWAALSASTLAQKKTQSILRETSTLMGSISSSPGAQQVKVSAGTAYGIFHQTGTSRMSARKFLGIGDRHVPKIKTIFEDYINSALG